MGFRIGIIVVAFVFLLGAFQPAPKWEYTVIHAAECLLGVSLLISVALDAREERAKKEAKKDV